jgi:hypothetical protein
MNVADGQVLTAVQCIATKAGNICERAEGIKRIEAIFLDEGIATEDVMRRSSINC